MRMLFARGVSRLLTHYRSRGALTIFGQADRNNPTSSDQSNLQASHLGRQGLPIRRLSRIGTDIFVALTQ